MTKHTTTKPFAKPAAKQLPRLITALFAATLMTAATLAQAWTDKPVKLLVPAPAGGTRCRGGRYARCVSTLALGRMPHRPTNRASAASAVSRSSRARSSSSSRR